MTQRLFRARCIPLHLSIASRCVYHILPSLTTCHCTTLHHYALRNLVAGRQHCGDGGRLHLAAAIGELVQVLQSHRRVLSFQEATDRQIGSRHIFITLQLAQDALDLVHFTVSGKLSQNQLAKFQCGGTSFAVFACLLPTSPRSSLPPRGGPPSKCWRPRSALCQVAPRKTRTGTAPCPSTGQDPRSPSLPPQLPGLPLQGFQGHGQCSPLRPIRPILTARLCDHRRHRPHKSHG